MYDQPLLFTMPIDGMISIVMNGIFETQQGSISIQNGIIRGSVVLTNQSKCKLIGGYWWDSRFISGSENLIFSYIREIDGLSKKIRLLCAIG